MTELEPCRRCGRDIEMVVTDRRRRIAVEPALREHATLVVLPPLAGTGFVERRVIDMVQFGENAVRTPTHRRHECDAKGRRRG